MTQRLIASNLLQSKISVTDGESSEEEILTLKMLKTIVLRTWLRS